MQSGTPERIPEPPQFEKSRGWIWLGAALALFLGSSEVYKNRTESKIIDHIDRMHGYNYILADDPSASVGKSYRQWVDRDLINLTGFSRYGQVELIGGGRPPLTVSMERSPFYKFFEPSKGITKTPEGKSETLILGKDGKVRHQ